MSIESSSNPPVTAPTPAAAPARTTKQIRASALVDGRAVKAKWKTLIPEALALWPRVHAEELANVKGNFHVLAGLVQLRHQLSREESDQQVRAFFDKHYPPC
jgi:hypothetical protein